MHRILVIEDDALSRDYIVSCLQNRYEVVSAPNGEKGLLLASLMPPDLVVCDISMPGMDGFEVLRRMQEQSTTPDVPFIFLTAMDDRSSVREGMKLGADDYLTKPVSITDLLTAVHTQLNKKLRREERMRSVVEQLRNNITMSLPHELRTAILIIEGYAHLAMEDQQKDAEIQQDMLRSIRDNAERLHVLAEKFLWYVRTHVGAHEYPPGAVTKNVDEIIRAAAVIQAEKQDRLADLQFEVQPGQVCMHEEYLKQVTRELVENAFKFSEPGSAVMIQGAEQNDVYQLVITDHGRGMTGAQIAAIGGFMQFDRGRYEQQGTGLGLVIAKRLVETVGGTFKIESAGKQTNVSLSLPCA